MRGSASQTLRQGDFASLDSPLSPPGAQSKVLSACRGYARSGLHSLHPPPPFGQRTRAKSAVTKPSALRPHFSPGSCRASFARAARMLFPASAFGVRIYIVFVSGKVYSRQSVGPPQCRSRKSIRPWSEASRLSPKGKSRHARPQALWDGIYLWGGCASARPDACCAASIERSLYALTESSIKRREAS